MSDYISKSALIKALKNHPNVFEQFGHIESIGLENVVETINSLPTLDEKEIIRKAFERVVERLEEELKLSDIEKERCIRENPLQFDEAKGYSMGIYNAIEFVKEVGDIK